MKRVLVTGATGFIGRHSLDTLLQRGFEVHAVTSGEPRSRRLDCHWHSVNLLDASQVKSLLQQAQPTHLLHFAWYAVPGKYWTAEENFQWVQASLELLQQFRNQGGQRVVMAGTCAEYDWSYGYCSEALTPTKPSLVYGVCKQALQAMLTVYAEQTGLSSAWGRIFFLYGSYESPSRLVASVIRSLLANQPALCSHGNQIRDFLHVQDVADAFVALLESEVKGTVNIASGVPITLKALIYKIAVMLKHSDLIQLGAIAAAEKEVPFLVANTERLLHEVRWTPKYSLDEGLVHTIEWWKKQLEVKV